MKKLLLVLAVVVMASFLLVGCLPGTTPAEGEGEGEGECEVTVEIENAAVVDGKTYVSGGTHDVTVTFCAPVIGNVDVTITGCGGDYRTEVFPGDAVVVVMFPDATRTIWTGSATFGGESGDDAGCCASLVKVTSGECLDEVCIEFPVIVDSCPPYAVVDIDVEDCECEDCKLVFTTGESEGGECAPDEECCGDDCSGLASWSVVLYDGDPFDECCDPSICEEPIGSCSGTACPIECETECLDAGMYYAVITLVDNVGLETVYYAQIDLTGDGSTENCAIEVREGIHPVDWVYPDDCIVWGEGTTDHVGTCVEVCPEEEPS